ncbi:MULTISPECIES: DUF3530 family protein [Marinomonas]|jgi:dienelactone hydrolase|uniref:DUF3530 family protein n=1 Tax=Marinomonas TaxID=28253 RepID=UPI0010554297|nr:DUF3530 family protein [Marinomonas sp. KMM3893]
MKKNTKRFIQTILLGLTLPLSSIAKAAEDSPTSPPQPNSTKRVVPDPEKSRIQALEDTLKQNHLAHQINILQAQGSPFLTLYRSALTGDSQGCAILLQSDNEHPDWPSVISPLRNALPKYSWCTVSIEIPDITKRAQAVKIPTKPLATGTQDTPSKKITLPNQEMVFARIQATIDDAKSKGNNKQFVFIGYGTGAAYALHFLAQNKTLGDALILIDTLTPSPTTDYDLAQELSVIEQPVLDYYFDDSAQALRFAVWRKQAANQRKGETGEFTQLTATDEANAPVEDVQQVLQRVRGFLKQNTAQTEQLKSIPAYKKGLFYESP